MGKKIKRRSRGVQELTADIYALLQEKITGIKLIKSVVSEPDEINTMEKQNNDYFNIFKNLLFNLIIHNKFTIYFFKFEFSYKKFIIILFLYLYLYSK